MLEAFLKTSSFFARFPRCPATAPYCCRPAIRRLISADADCHYFSDRAAISHDSFACVFPIDATPSAAFAAALSRRRAAEPPASLRRRAAIKYSPVS